MELLVADDEQLYRGALKRWIKWNEFEERFVLDEAAYYRRESDKKGLTVTRARYASPTELTEVLDTNGKQRFPAVISLYAGPVRHLSLDVEAKDDLKYANITGLPEYQPEELISPEDKKTALELAMALRDLSNFAIEPTGPIADKIKASPNN